MFKQLAMVAFAATLSFSTAHAVTVNAMIDDYSDEFVDGLNIPAIGLNGNVLYDISGGDSDSQDLAASSSNFVDTTAADFDRTISFSKIGGSNTLDSFAQIDKGTLIIGAAAGASTNTISTYRNTTANGFNFEDAGTPLGDPLFEGFILDLLSIDNKNGMDITLQLTDISTSSQSETISVDSAGQILFSSGLFTGVNLKSVSEIVLTFAGGADTDATFNFFGYGYVSVPEPAPLTLLGIGLVGMIFTRRRKAS